MTDTLSLGNVLLQRFPTPLRVVDHPRWAFAYTLTLAEARCRFGPPLTEPERVAAGFVERQARFGWALVGGAFPGSAVNQRTDFEKLVEALARHLAKRARERAVYRHEVAATGEEPASTAAIEAVVARMDVFVALRALHGVLTSDTERRFIEALIRHPEVWDSLGVYGETPYLAERLGLSPDNVRQLCHRIRAAVASSPDAA